MPDPKDLEAEALAACENDPIRTPRKIQSCGCVLAADAQTGQVTHASVNVDAFLGQDAWDILGHPLTDVFDAEVIHGIRNAALNATIESQRQNAATFEYNGERLTISLHRRAGQHIFEIQRTENDLDTAAALDRVRWLLAHISTHQDIEEMLQEAVQHLRGISGYDRVMAYVFLPDGSGEVVAESRAGHAEPYLGLRYPAFDIPQQARALYKSTPIRIIADVNADDVPLLAMPGLTDDLDLSLSLLRGTMPVHLQYLRNMGVGASMSLPIVIDGDLWGLFASHNMAPRHLGPNTAFAYELCGNLLSMQAQKLIRIKREQLLAQSMSIANTLIAVDDSDLATSVYWKQARVDLKNMIKSDGIAYCMDNDLETYGNCPPPEGCLAVRDLAPGNGITAIENLAERLSKHPLGDTGGALIIPLNGAPQTHLIYFRDRITKTLTWGGKPEKHIEETDAGIRLHPRGSFAAYKQEIQNQADDWTRDDLEIAQSLQQALSGALNTRRELRDNRHRLGLMVRELNHRVRNILTLISALASQTAMTATSLETYTASLQERIVALAAAHDMLTETGTQTVSVHDIAGRELAPYVRAEAMGQTLRGPHVRISSDAVTVFALVIHELVSNAVKYGALSTETGTVDLSWEWENNGLLIQWRESGGPDVQPPKNRGFGRTVIENALAYELDGRSTLSFASHGVEADLWIPKSQISSEHHEPQSIAPAPAMEGPRTEPEPSPSPHNETPARALILEDNYTIMMASAKFLEDLGYGPVDCFSWPDQAARAVEANTYELCLLDVNLHGTSGLEFAANLKDRGIPFIFATGYGQSGIDRSQFAGVPILTKPFGKGDVEVAIQKLFGD